MLDSGDTCHHHELLQLVEAVVVAPPLEELAGGHEVAAAGLQAGIQLLQQPLEGPQAPLLQTGLQQALQKHLLGALLLHGQGQKSTGHAAEVWRQLPPLTHLG